MTALAENVIKNALTLSPVDRAELIERLFFSFDTATERPVDEKWNEEVESRFIAYDKGEIKASSAEDVFDRISKR